MPFKKTTPTKGKGGKGSPPAKPRGKGQGPAANNGSAGKVDMGKVSSDIRERWAAARKQEARIPGSVPDIEDGIYVAKIVGASFSILKWDEKIDDEKTGKKKKTGKKLEIPSVSIRFVISRGAAEGKQPICNVKLNSEIDCEQFSSSFQLLGYDVSEVELDELPELAKMVAADYKKSGVEVSIKIRNRIVGADKYQDVFIRGLATDDDAPDPNA